MGWYSVRVMGKRQKAWAKSKRIQLMAQLGGKCAHCGATVRLEFDCIDPQGGAHHKLSSDMRMCFYRSQHRRGNIQILCEECNHRKSWKDVAVLDARNLSQPAFDGAGATSSSHAANEPETTTPVSFPEQGHPF